MKALPVQWEGYVNVRVHFDRPLSVEQAKSVFGQYGLLKTQDPRLAIYNATRGRRVRTAFVARPKFLAAADYLQSMGVHLHMKRSPRPGKYRSLPRIRLA